MSESYVTLRAELLSRLLKYAEFGRDPEFTEDERERLSVVWASINSRMNIEIIYEPERKE